MLQPKKQKYRRQQKARTAPRIAYRGAKLAFGNFGLQAASAGRISSAQLEAARKAITHNLKREGKVWIRVFPDKPVTKFPAEVKMGKGKGALSHYVAPVEKGRIMFEIGGVDGERAREALRRAAHKLPVKGKIITK
ncbi:MAG: 50S ribosomal protein L16 [Candidatus Omnitrophota bacterium]|nr:MAG: 50S ribosomal protein L16 [Candidatus Omnitrophota bacterium]